jgi:hypothetical protein
MRSKSMSVVRCAGSTGMFFVLAQYLVTGVSRFRSPHNSAFDLITMRPTQYMIMVTIACGVTNKYGAQP